MVFKRTGAGGASGPAAAAGSPAIASAAPAATQPTPTPAGSATAPGASLAVTAPASSTDRHTTLGWAGVASGLAAGVAGAILIGIDGNGTCPDYPAKACPKEFQTRTGGIVLVAGGVLAVAAGVLALLGKI
jgi:hypothetical protein